MKSDTEDQSVTESISSTTESWFEEIHQWLEKEYFGDTISFYTGVGIVSVCSIGIAFITYLFVRYTFVELIHKIVRKTKNKWDDALIDQKFFAKVAHVVPATVIYYSAEFFPLEFETFVERLALCYLILVAVRSVNSFLNALNEIYGYYEYTRTNPINGFVQGAKILIYIIAGIFWLSVILDKEPWGLVAGIGAVTAVLLLVFKDTILGFVASIQIIMNDLVHMGDWIEVPQYGADGDIIDITLTTLKVQNWDKTITTLPTYALISGSFKNWRGMQESQGRRIKRSISLDMNTVRFLTNDLLKRYGKVEFLEGYIEKRSNDIEQYNEIHQVNEDEPINGRRMTNLGLFRNYVKSYLSHNSQIHPEMTFLVRYLQSTAEGIPMELYIFSKDKNWVNYEEIQADIMDHLLAVIPEFGLRVFQNPTGVDFERAFSAK